MDAITILSSMATRHILTDLAKAFDNRFGRAVAIRAMGGVEAAHLVRSGEVTDVVLLASAVMAKLEAEGHLLAGTRRDFARSGIALAVPAGMPHPDISDEAAVRTAMITARRVCFSTGPSGDHLKRLCERWGIADVISQSAMQAPPGMPVATILARGDADLGVQQFSELTGVAGIEIVGPMPPDIQSTTIFTAGIASMSAQVAAGRAFVDLLCSAEAVSVIEQYGMVPAEQT